METADLFLTGGDRVRARDGNSILYIDKDHLSVAGARVGKERIETVMADILREVKGVSK